MECWKGVNTLICIWCTAIWIAEFAQAEFLNDFFDTIKVLVVKEHVDAVLQANKQK